MHGNLYKNYCFFCSSSESCASCANYKTLFPGLSHMSCSMVPSVNASVDSLIWLGCVCFRGTFRKLAGLGIHTWLSSWEVMSSSCLYKVSTILWLFFFSNRVYFYSCELTQVLSSQLMTYFQSCASSTCSGFAARFKPTACLRFSTKSVFSKFSCVL